ncbi:unnamed protein product [Brassica oleracea var. botrytis]|uniref:(rape) hypothetical protein n=1 Tax=Brassica napus TaxID=3708 RepID=A0A816PZZ6_BRANA|nr:unnamed protein product [Brassica napus]
MTLMKPSASLDTWRDYFRPGDSDIFGIIEHAIMVADTDSPEELRSRRYTIVELLFSCQGSRCIGCDQPDLSKSGDNETNNGRKTMDTDDGAHEEDEMKLNNSQIVDEVMRIKDILLNKNDEVLSLYFNYIRGSDNFRPSVLFESLRNLTSMSITLDLIKGSEIGKAVNRLRKHGSDKISKLAKTLIESMNPKKKPKLPFRVSSKMSRFAGVGKGSSLPKSSNDSPTFTGASNSVAVTATSEADGTLPYLVDSAKVEVDRSLQAVRSSDSDVFPSPDGKACSVPETPSHVAAEFVLSKKGETFKRSEPFINGASSDEEDEVWFTKHSKKYRRALRQHESWEASGAVGSPPKSAKFLMRANTSGGKIGC